MNDFILAWQTYRQNKNDRDNRLVRWTQGLLIFFLLTLTLTSASVQTYLLGNLEALLGSDMVIVQFQPLNTSQWDYLSGVADSVSETSVQPVALTRGEEWQRVQLKLVDDNYPVQGELKTSQTPGGTSESVKKGPGVDEVWVDSRVVTALGTHVGDSVSVAGTDLTITHILQHEPDRLMEGHTVEMRAMVHQESFSDDSLAHANRRYRYLINAGEEQQRSAIAAWVTREFPAAQLLDRHQGQHPLAAYWVRVENFLGLASVLLFFMAAIALNMAGRRQLEKQKHRLAIYSSMGVPLARSLRLALQEWMLAFGAALLPAVLLAYGAQHFLVNELQNQFAGISSGIHAMDVLKTTLLVFMLLLSVQVPSFIQLARTSVISLVRQQPQSRFAIWQLCWSFITLAVLATVYSDNWLLTAMTLSAMGVAALLMMLLTWLILTVGELWGRKRAGILMFAFFIMRKRLFSKSTQILGLGLCATLLLFTLMLMKDIGNAMHSQLRAENGNLMISDARDHQMDAIKQWATASGSVIRHTSPYTHAVVTGVNGQAIEEFVSQPSETSARLERPVRLSWSEAIPANNRLTGGEWWHAEDKNWQQLSVEGEVMLDMGLDFGDVLTFDVQGNPYDFTITATHGFKPGGSNITYWFEVPELALKHIEAPVHHMGSMELPPDAWGQLSRLLGEHPTLAVVSLQEMTERFDNTLAIVTRATVGFSAMILLLSLFVIVASVSGFEADDRKRNGLLRSMGFGTQDCLKLTFYEWLVTGLIAAVGAVAGTWVAGQLIYHDQFGLVYSPDYALVTATLVITCVIVCAVGLFFCREILKTSVRELITD